MTPPKDPIAMLKARQGTRTQADLARDIPCSAPYLCDLFKGRRNPGKLIFDYLGIEAIEQVTYRRARRGRR